MVLFAPSCYDSNSVTSFTRCIIKTFIIGSCSCVINTAAWHLSLIITVSKLLSIGIVVSVVAPFEIT